ncbi:MAG: glycosyltransferase family 2 protein [Candidatus Zixiibacteriota bacterium]
MSELQVSSDSSAANAAVSVVILAKNEAKNIRACIASVNWADEVIVIDSGSTDDTTKIACDCGARVSEVEWIGFGPAKQCGVDLAQGPWVLSLDADERVSAELAQEIRSAIANSAFLGYRIPRLTSFVGKWVRHGGWYPDYVLRLFHKANGRFTPALVHESVEVDGPLGKLANHLLHYSYDSIEDYISRLNRYTSLAARQLYDNGAKFSLWQALFKPPAVFLKRYLLKLGFLDGWTGLQIAFLSSVYVFTKYAKLAALGRSERRDN